MTSLVKVCGHRGEQSRATPNQSSGDDDPLAREAQRKRPHERRRTHVEDEEDAGQKAEGRVAAMELRFDQVLYGKQHGTVDVIEQVQRRQQRQCRPRIEFRRGHRSSEYSMVKNRKADSAKSQLPDHFLPFLPRGQRAITTVEIPPRGRNSPFTSAHTGRAQRTTSSNT